MTQQVATARRSPPATRWIIQGLGSLVLIVVIFYFLLRGIDFGRCGPRSGR
jgi:hypothetical protein